MSGRGKDGSAVGSMLVFLGFVAIIGVAFGGGFMAGRFWPDLRARMMKPAAVTAAPDRPTPTTGASGTRGKEASARVSDSAPALTFYQELTAPLAARAATPTRTPTAPPKAEPPKPEAVKAEAAKTEAPKVESPKAETAKVEAAKPESSAADRTSTAAAKPRGATGDATSANGTSEAPRESPPPGASTRNGTYTVQLAAYRTLAQAEALRDKLATRGVSADVSQATTPAGVLYRVRVGSYATRAEAVEAAARIAAEVRVETFVATR